MVNTDGMTAEMIKELAFSEEELESLAKVRNTPIAFDEDCPDNTIVRQTLKGYLEELWENF